jgi:hypothetical protein
MFYVVYGNSYGSKVTLYPLAISEITSPYQDINLSKLYTPDYTMDLFLFEISKPEVRREIYNDFLSKNNFGCKDEYLNTHPDIRTYNKIDSSFPHKGNYVEIFVSSHCKGLSEKYTPFFTQEVKKRIISSINNNESVFFSQALNQSEESYNKIIEATNLFILYRKKLLEKFIENSNGKGPDDTIIKFINGIGIIQTPLSVQSAKLELSFISSIKDAGKLSIELIKKHKTLEQFKLAPKFNDKKLVNFSKGSKEEKSKKSLYLYLFFVFITYGINVLINTIRK